MAWHHLCPVTACGLRSLPASRRSDSHCDSAANSTVDGSANRHSNGLANRYTHSHSSHAYPHTGATDRYSDTRAADRYTHANTYSYADTSPSLEYCRS